MQYTPYNNPLKKLHLEDLAFQKTDVIISPPEYKDFSNHPDPAYKNYKPINRELFVTSFLDFLSQFHHKKALKAMVIHDKEKLEMDAFIYFETKEIICKHIPKHGNFMAWMNHFLEERHQSIEEDRKNGLFERQPELNPNPPIMAIFENTSVQFRSVHTGLLVDIKPYEKTGLFLHKNAPKKYKEKSENEKKVAFLKPYINFKRTYNLTKIEDYLFDLIGVKVVENPKTINYEETYQKFEKEAGYAFPEELKVLPTIAEYVWEIPSCNVFNPKDIMEEWENWNIIYKDWSLEDLTSNNFGDQDKTIGMYTNPFWVPFMSTGGGNFIAMDFAPNKNGKSGQIIAFGSDEIKIRLLADNLEEFYMKMANGEDVCNFGFD